MIEDVLYPVGDGDAVELQALPVRLNGLGGVSVEIGTSSAWITCEAARDFAAEILNAVRLVEQAT